MNNATSKASATCGGGTVVDPEAAEDGGTMGGRVGAEARGVEKGDTWG